MKRWTSSQWISLIVILLIPLSWVVQFLFNQLMLVKLITELGADKFIELKTLDKFFLDIPLTHLVTLATVVIPAIFLRKAVREGTTNLTLPVGEHGGRTDK